MDPASIVRKVNVLYYAMEEHLLHSLWYRMCPIWFDCVVLFLISGFHYYLVQYTRESVYHWARYNSFASHYHFVHPHIGASEYKSTTSLWIVLHGKEMVGMQDSVPNCWHCCDCVRFHWDGDHIGMATMPRWIVVKNSQQRSTGKKRKISFTKNTFLTDTLAECQL